MGIVARHFVDEQRPDGLITFQGRVRTDLVERFERQHEDLSDGMSMQPRGRTEKNG